MINSEDFRKACGTFDSAKCAAMLNGLLGTEMSSSPFILEEHVRQSGCLIQPRIKKEDEVRRAQFLTYCRSEITNSRDSELLDRFEQHVKHAELLEQGYRAILETLKNSPAGQLPPANQIWAAVGRAIREIVVLEEQIKKTASVQEDFFDPVGAKVKREGAPDIDPDFVVSTVTNVLGSTIMMLAHENGWIQNKRLTLPGFLATDEQTLLQAGSTA